VVGKLSMTESLFHEMTASKDSMQTVPYSVSELVTQLMETDKPAYAVGGISSIQSPSIRLNISKNTSKLNSPPQLKSPTNLPTNILSVELGRLHLEVDISIADRIKDILDPGPLFEKGWQTTD